MIRLVNTLSFAGVHVFAGLCLTALGANPWLAIGLGAIIAVLCTPQAEAET